MSEEIIIDGINVAECGFHCWKHTGNELIENYCAIFNNKCLRNPDCYYKQLQRLKQENEELKAKYENVLNLAKQNADANEYCLKELETKFEKYKQALEEVRDILCFGKTFYDGYWDNPETFTQSDKIILKINEVLNEK